MSSLIFFTLTKCGTRMQGNVLLRLLVGLGVQLRVYFEHITHEFEIRTGFMYLESIHLHTEEVEFWWCLRTMFTYCFNVQWTISKQWSLFHKAFKTIVLAPSSVPMFK
jgi:hypothetical protein